MITKLTKKQEAQIPVYIKKWVDLASEPIDRAKVKTIFNKIYGTDKIVVIGESFQNMLDLIKVATEGKKMEYDSQLYSQLNSQLYSQLNSQLDSQLNSQLYSQKDLKWSYYVSYYLYDWAGYYDYAKSIGVEFDENSLQQYFDILLNIPVVVFIGDVIFICEKPKVSWNNGLLHHDKLPAIRWADGTGIYFLNSVRFDKELFETVVSGTMPFKDILAIVDIDQRTQAMRYGDVWEFIKYAKAEKLDEYTKFRQDGTELHYWLYKFPKGEIFTEDAYYCIYDDLVPESTKQYMSGVTPCATVAEAMSWKFSGDTFTLTPEDWKQLVPGVNQN